MSELPQTQYNENTGCSTTLIRETEILRIYGSLLIRDFPKYWKMYTALYIGPSMGLYPSMKPGGFFCRAVDDMADGDMALPSNFANFAQLTKNLEATIRGDSPPTLPLSLVLLDAISKFELEARSDDDIKGELIAFLSGMTMDSNRRINQETLSRVDLHKIYDLTFLPPIQLSLIGLRSINRAIDIPKLGQVQGRIYALRDYANELPKGSINIPEDIIFASGLTSQMLIDTPQLVVENQVLASWIQTELHECANIITEIKSISLDNNARAMTMALITPIEKFIVDNIR